MKDICAIKSIYFQHKVLRKTQKRCIFLTSTDFKAFLYVIPLINFKNSKIYQQICILAVFFVSQLFWYILCFVLQSSLFKGSKLAQSKERRPNLVNLPVWLCNIYHHTQINAHYSRGFFVRFFVNSGAKKTQKISLKLSTSEARSKFCSIFLGFYY